MHRQNVRSIERLELHPDLLSAKKEISKEERQKRIDFVSRSRLLLSTALGYPAGLPNLGGQPEQKVSGVEGFDEFVFTRVYGVHQDYNYRGLLRKQIPMYSSPMNGPLLLALQHRTVELGLEDITVKDQSFAVPAFQGNYYYFSSSTKTVRPFWCDIRSAEARTQAGISLQNGNHAYVGIPHSLPLTPIGAANASFDVFSDMNARQEVEASVLPVIENALGSFMSEVDWQATGL